MAFWLEEIMRCVVRVQGECLCLLCSCSTSSTARTRANETFSRQFCIEYTESSSACVPTYESRSITRSIGECTLDYSVHGDKSVVLYQSHLAAAPLCVVASRKVFASLLQVCLRNGASQRGCRVAGNPWKVCHIAALSRELIPIHS